MLNALSRRLKISSLARKMRTDWDERARSDAFYFVASSDEKTWTEEDFFATGEKHIQEQVLTDMTNICQDRNPSEMRVLEIGCGVGRITRSLAKVFGEVHAVDVSLEMVSRARHYLQSTPNATVHCNSGTDLDILKGLKFDFVFSYIVFQHIPNKEIIAGYVREVGKLLHRGSLFKFQVQGVHTEALKKPSRDTWMGVSISVEEAEEMAAKNGFELRYMQGAGTQYFWLWFFKK